MYNCGEQCILEIIMVFLCATTSGYPFWAQLGTAKYGLMQLLVLSCVEE